ncbi:hypothetical protein RDI58_014735 [Solanum bulbocastanum]|uniref:Reverse transcriptase domain-containing protein n=1 Tax=Solanum bulbocastanum TaxID=147425 RepID=A0AAN8TFJ4_SOLBU
MHEGTDIELNPEYRAIATIETPQHKARKTPTQQHGKTGMQKQTGKDNNNNKQATEHNAEVLLPKVNNPTKLKEFRPISLSNFISKIISKLLSTRLGPILPDLISLNQSGFVKAGVFLKISCWLKN